MQLFCVEIYPEKSLHICEKQIVMSLEKKLSSLEEKVLRLSKSQKQFTERALMLLSLSVKDIYSKEEAAAFLNLSPQYLYQLHHHGKLKAIKKKGQKKIYFRKSDLEEYLSQSETDEHEESYDDFENEIVGNWQK